MSSYQIGLLFGFTIGLIVTLIFAIKQKKRTEYDERQMSIRGRGYFYSFITMMVLGFTYAFIQEEVPLPVSPGLVIIIMLLLSGTVLNAYLIFHDAYWGYKYTNVVKYIFSFVTLFLLNLFMTVKSVVDHKMFQNGILGLNEGLYPVLTVFFLLLTLNILLKMFLDKHRKDD